MKTTLISELPIVPEDYAPENYMKVADEKLLIHMAEEERCFVNGLIKYYEPNSIIEIGVHRGEGTVTILNAADESAVLVSVDKAVEWYQYGKICTVGELLTDNYSNLRKDNWHLITGKDPSEVMEELDMTFDFAIIDSGHYHPCETMNFISVLPYLNDGAIVIIHDTTNYLYVKEHYAPRLLVSSVCADKISPGTKSRLFPNIVAFQITQDTRKYIQNVFDILLYPWYYFDENDVSNVRKLVKKHYQLKQQQTFDMAMQINKHLKAVKVKESISRLAEDTIFYGAGNMCRLMLTELAETGVEFNHKIWDKNADIIHKLLDKPVFLPDYKTQARPGQKMIVMIEDNCVAGSVREQFEPLGYKIYHGLKSLSGDAE